MMMAVLFPQFSPMENSIPTTAPDAIDTGDRRIESFRDRMRRIDDAKADQQRVYEDGKPVRQQQEDTKALIENLLNQVKVLEATWFKWPSTLRAVRKQVREAEVVLEALDSKVQESSQRYRDAGVAKRALEAELGQRTPDNAALYHRTSRVTRVLPGQTVLVELEATRYNGKAIIHFPESAESDDLQMKQELALQTESEEIFNMTRFKTPVMTKEQLKDRITEMASYFGADMKPVGPASLQFPVVKSPLTRTSVDLEEVQIADGRTLLRLPAEFVALFGNYYTDVENLSRFRNTIRFEVEKENGNVDRRPDELEAGENIITFTPIADGNVAITIETESPQSGAYAKNTHNVKVTKFQPASVALMLEAIPTRITLIHSNNKEQFLQGGERRLNGFITEEERREEDDWYYRQYDW